MIYTTYRNFEYNLMITVNFLIVFSNFLFEIGSWLWPKAFSGVESGIVKSFYFLSLFILF